MSEVRPVLAETPLRQQQFIDPKTGCLTTYGHHVVTALFERTGGFDDDVWASLGLGFTAIAQQGRTDTRLTALEGAAQALASEVGGLRGDPRLQTADRADAQSKDALAVAFSRASPDVARRVEELERGLAVVVGALGEVRAQTQTSHRALATQLGDFVVHAGFERSLQSAQYQHYQDRAQQIQQQLEELEATFEDQARAAFSATAPVIYTEATGDFSLNASLTSLGGLSVVADRFAYSTGADTWALGTITTFGRSLIDDADAGTARTTLGLGSLATLSTINNGNWSGAALAVANGGTGATTTAGARTNLGFTVGTGWTAATGTATRTTFDTASVTLPQLAERVKALIDDLIAYPAIGA